MTQDILEELVDGWFSRKEKVFTKHNVRYKPTLSDVLELSKEDKNKYTVSSDIDVIAIQNSLDQNKNVSVVSCKSYQPGFDVDGWYRALTTPGSKGYNKVWKRMRELVNPIWAKAFRNAVYKETLSCDFTYYIAVTKLKNRQALNEFINCKEFLYNLNDQGKNKVEIKFIT